MLYLECNLYYENVKCESDGKGEGFCAMITSGKKLHKIVEWDTGLMKREKILETLKNTMKKLKVRV